MLHPELCDRSWSLFKKQDFGGNPMLNTRSIQHFLEQRTERHRAPKRINAGLPIRAF
jgi:hypothetical protein